ncbi:DNA fragmentation factor subunit alpha-like [Glandiceps talaboti]
MTTDGKPCKVWDSARDIRKSLIARNLKDLLHKGKTKLLFSETEEVTLVLEDDGTEVDEEDYFQLLPSNTIFLLLGRNEKWKPACPSSTKVHNQSLDEVDFKRSSSSQVVKTTEVDGNNVDPRLVDVATRIQYDIAALITLSNLELQLVVACDTYTLASLVENTEEFASALQNACQRYLDDRESATEAVELLKLYHRARKSKGQGDNMQT